MKPTCKVNVELRLVKRRTQADYIVDPFFPQQKRGRKFTSLIGIHFVFSTISYVLALVKVTHLLFFILPVHSLAHRFLPHWFCYRNSERVYGKYLLRNSVLEVNEKLTNENRDYITKMKKVGEIIGQCWIPSNHQLSSKFLLYLFLLPGCTKDLEEA